MAAHLRPRGQTTTKRDKQKRAEWLKPAAGKCSGLLGGGRGCAQRTHERLRSAAGLGNDDCCRRTDVDEVVGVVLVDSSDRRELDPRGSFGSRHEKLTGYELKLHRTEARSIRTCIQAAVVANVPPAIEATVEDDVDDCQNRESDALCPRPRFVGDDPEQHE